MSGTVDFDARKENQRCALALINNVVYVMFASHGDNGPYHGWVLGYSATNYQLVAAWNANPNGSDCGIWEGGGGMVSDTAGNLYFLTGNGSFTQPTYSSGSNVYVNGQYGDSFVKLAPDTVHNSSTNQNGNGWGLKVVDYFTPYYQSGLSGSDKDLGSGAPLLLPSSVGSASHQNLIVGGGKQGTMYLVDTNDMGEYNSSSDNVVQEGTAVVKNCFSAPIYFNNEFYVQPGSGGNLVAFSISNASYTTVNSSTDTFSSTTPGCSPCLSGTGPNDPNAIVWAVDGNGTMELRAYKASNLADEIYNSTESGSNTGVSLCRMSSPMVANTRVYVSGSNGALYVYGIYGAPPTVAPGAPSSLTAAASGTGSILLNWMDSTGVSATAVQIQESTNGVTFNQIASISGTSQSYSVTGLSSGSSYHFRVDEVNQAGSSSNSNTASAPTYCAAPVGPAAIGGSNSVAIEWNASTGATSYDLYRALASGSEGSTAYKTGLTGTTYSDTSITDGTTYYYTMSGVNAAGAGPQSVEFTATTSATMTFSQWKLQEFGSVFAAESAQAADTADPATASRT